MRQKDINLCLQSMAIMESKASLEQGSLFSAIALTIILMLILYMKLKEIKLLKT